MTIRPNLLSLGGSFLCKEKYMNMENNIERKIKKISILTSGIPLFLFLSCFFLPVGNLPTIIANIIFVLLVTAFIMGIILFLTRKFISNKLIKITSSTKITKKHLLILFSCLCIIFLFYWFQLRPNMVRKSCADEVTAKYRGHSFIDVNNYYRLCLAKHLMKPESLFVNQ